MGFKIGDIILRELREKFRIDEDEFVALLVARRSRDPFKIIVATIISQNTAEKNTSIAFERLERKIGVIPESIARASLSEIEEAIKYTILYL